MSTECSLVARQRDGRRKLVMTKSMYDLCANVLGRDRSESTFHELVAELGEEPVLAIENTHVAYYDFRNSGIQFIFKKAHGCFRWVIFYVDKSIDEKFEPYDNQLVSGIETNSSLSQIQAKLIASASQMSVEHFDDQAMLYLESDAEKLTFYFTGNGEKLQRLSVENKLTGYL